MTKSKKKKKILKEKQTKTLAKMKEVRKNDFVFLREIIKGKLQYAKTQKQRGEQAIEKAKYLINQNQITMYKLEGMIMVLKELLEEKTEAKKENKKEEK